MDVPDRAKDLELFTRAEVAAILRVKETWLRDHQAELPCTRVGGLVRYSRADIQEIIRRGQQRPVQEVPAADLPITEVELTPLPKRPVGRAKKRE
jgi:hypothetical protein